VPAQVPAPAAITNLSPRSPHAETVIAGTKPARYINLGPAIASHGTFVPLAHRCTASNFAQAPLHLLNKVQPDAPALLRKNRSAESKRRCGVQEKLAD
jgi:hypothetical protein